MLLILRFWALYITSTRTTALPLQALRVPTALAGGVVLMSSLLLAHDAKNLQWAFGSGCRGELPVGLITQCLGTMLPSAKGVCVCMFVCMYVCR